MGTQSPGTLFFIGVDKVKYMTYNSNQKGEVHMANRKGLNVSKKFAKGTVHETGTGQFGILDRFEGEDGQPWLKFEWLSGDKVGKIETNKESNVNANLHKFITNRKASGEMPITRVVDDMTIMGKIDMLLKAIEKLSEESLVNGENVKRGMEVALSTRDSVEKLIAQMDRMLSNNELVVRQQEMLNKMIEKI